MKKQRSDNNRILLTSHHPLEGMHRLTLCQLQALEYRWLTTIDSFVAAASTEDGRAGLCRALDVEPEALDVLLQDARDSLGEERYRELSTARAGGPTGALWDGESVRRVDDEPDDVDKEP